MFLTKLQRYVLREIVKVLLLAVAGIAAMILLGLCVRLLREGLRPIQLRGILLYLLPFTLPFAVPCGILVASVMAFGRLSGDNELLAMRSSGINLWRVVWPILGLGAALAVGSMYLNNDVLPWCHRQVANNRQKLIGPYLEKLGADRQSVELPPYVVYVGSVDPQNARRWHWVTAVEYADEFVAQIILAKTGSISYDPVTRTAVLTLSDGYVIRPIGEGQETYVRFPKDVRYAVDLSKERSDRPVKAAQMNLRQLLKQRDKVAAALAGKPTIARPRAARRELERTMGLKDAQLDKVVSKRKQCVAEISGLDEQADQLTREVSTLEDRRAVAEENTLSQAKMLKMVNEDLGETRRRMDAAPEGSEDSRRLAEKLRDLTAKRAELDSSLARLGAEAAKSQSELGTVRDALAKNRSRAQELAKDKAALDAEGARLARERVRMREQLKVLESQRQLVETDTQIHFRLAQSLACLVFALLGIPLGIVSRRGGVIVSFGVSFAVVLCLYYPVYTFGKQMAQGGYLPASAAMWLPNAVCGVLGAVLLWRTVRS